MMHRVVRRLRARWPGAKASGGVLRHVDEAAAEYDRDRLRQERERQEQARSRRERAERERFGATWRPA